MRWSKSVSLVAFVLVAVLIASGVGASVWAQSGVGVADRIAPPGQVAPPCTPLNLNLNTGRSVIGTVDPNWKLVSAPQTAASPPATTAYTVTPYSAWFTPSSGANWISPFPRDYFGPVGNYVYETTFSVSSAYTNIVLNIDLYGGDNVVNVLLLNGNLIGSTNRGYNVSPISPFPIGTPFVVTLQPGITYTLQATVNNFPSIPTPTGLLVAARVTADCVVTPPPAPTTGRIIVNKVIVPAGDPTVFQFTSGYQAPFSLGDGQTNDSGPIRPIAPAYYGLNEVPVPGWTTSIACKDPDGGTTVGPTAVLILRCQPPAPVLIWTLVRPSSAPSPTQK